MRSAAIPHLLGPLMRAGVAVLCLTASGCGDISNAVFEQDLEFVEALPSRDRHTLDTESVRGARNGRTSPPTDTPELLALSVSVALAVNGLSESLLQIVDEVRALPPSDRFADGRTWGPFQADDGLWVRLDIVRTDDGLYTWNFGAAAGQTAPATLDDYTPFFEGQHLAGETVADGQGTYTFDCGGLGGLLGGPGLSGTLTVDYDLRQGKQLAVSADDFRCDGSSSATYTADYWYANDDEQGDFEYRTTADVGGNSAEEDVEVRTRWRVGEGGRGDAKVTGGDAGDGEYWVDQCWDAEGQLTWQTDTLGALPEVGDEANCPFDDRAEVEHL